MVTAAEFCPVFCKHRASALVALHGFGPHVLSNPPRPCRPHARPARHARRRCPHDAPGQPAWRRRGRSVGARQAAAAHAWHAAGGRGVGRWMWNAGVLLIRPGMRTAQGAVVQHGGATPWVFSVTVPCVTCLHATPTSCYRAATTADVARRLACAPCRAARCRSCTRPSRRTR